jgi:hypothetical protein
MGEKVTRTYAILAHCHQCMGYYQDSKDSCQNPTCPLFTYMPYRKGETPDLSWTEFNPKRSGQVTWEDSRREIDDDTRAALVERMEKARESRKAGVDEEESDD